MSTRTEPSTREMSESTRRIQDHLHEITHELLHGKGSHEDPTLPENWDRLARLARGEDPDPAAHADIDLRGASTTDAAPPAMNLRNVEASIT